MLSIIWLMQSLRFMDLIINKGLDAGTFLWITALIVPSLLIVVFPLSLFAGACYSFKRLSDDNELSPLFNTGLSRKRILLPSFSVAMFCVAICYSLTLYFMPAGMSTFKEIQNDLRHSAGNLLLEEATFNPMGDGLMVYVKKRTGTSNLHSLLVHDTRDPKRPVTWMAKDGKITIDAQGFPRLTLIEGIRQEVSDELLNVLEFKEHTIDITKQISIKETRVKGHEERFLGELLRTEGLGERQMMQYKAEFQKRLLWPLAPLPLLFIASVCLIHLRKSRTGSFKSNAIACALATGYYALLMLCHNYASKGYEAFLYGQWLLPIIVCATCMIILLDLNFKNKRKGAVLNV